MATTTVSIEELERDAARVRKASENGPVFITEDGRPANVLLTIGEYRKLSGEQEDIVEPLGTLKGDDIPFDRSRAGAESMGVLKLPTGARRTRDVYLVTPAMMPTQARLCT